MSVEADELKARTKRFVLNILDFVARIGVALEEADESAFWLEIVVGSKISTARRGLELLDEANQLSAILAQSSLTASEHLKR